MFDIWTIVAIALYLCIIAGFFSIGRRNGFKREGNFEKTKCWGRIGIYFIIIEGMLIVSKVIWFKNYFATIDSEINSLSLSLAAAMIFGILILVALPGFIGYFSVPTKNARIIANCWKNLKRDRAIATGLGYFVAIIHEGKILLRNRTEKESLYGEDLSGNWELPGGGMDMGDLRAVDYKSGEYDKPVFNVISREAFEEVWLKIIHIKDMRIIPAYLFKDDIIDLAHVAIIPLTSTEKTPEYEKLLLEGKIAFFDIEEVKNLNIISSRMKFMIKKALSVT